MNDKRSQLIIDNILVAIGAAVTATAIHGGVDDDSVILLTVGLYLLFHK